MSAASIALATEACAATALWLHGATLNEIPLEEVLKRVPPDYGMQEVHYPAQLGPWTGRTTATGAQSIALGVPALDAALRTAMGKGHTVVIGESLGSLVVDQQLRNLAARPDAPDPSLVRFMLIASPGRPGGLISYLPAGAYEPLTGMTIEPIPATPYEVTVIKVQYDGIADWPDRPWHLLSVLNAIAGALYYHPTPHYSPAVQAALNGQVPAENITTTVNSRGGVTTTYKVPRNPALLYPLESIFPAAVAAVNQKLAPRINLGYSELTPDAGPHLAPGGRIVGKDGRLIRELQVRRPDRATPRPSVRHAAVTTRTPAAPAEASARQRSAR